MLFRDPNGISRMIVFLGNPGSRFDGTRHNIGFAVCDVLAERCHVTVNRLKNRALTAKADIGGCSVLLVKPQTMMNLSGESVRPLADFYKLSAESIIVVSDDVSMVPGRLRFRVGGSAGGHNGLRSIIGCLGTDRFVRLRLGVGAPPHPEYDMADWVLGSFHGQDADTMKKMYETAADALECCIRDGIDRAMTKFNN